MIRVTSSRSCPRYSGSTTRDDFAPLPCARDDPFVALGEYELPLVDFDRAALCIGERGLGWTSVREVEGSESESSVWSRMLLPARRRRFRSGGAPDDDEEVAAVEEARRDGPGRPSGCSTSSFEPIER